MSNIKEISELDVVKDVLGAIPHIRAAIKGAMNIYYVALICLRVVEVEMETQKYQMTQNNENEKN